MAAVPQESSELRVPAAVHQLCKPSDVVQKSASEWEVSCGQALVAFVDVLGPEAITRCNLQVHKPFAVQPKASDSVKVCIHSASRASSATVKKKHHLSDMLTLTTAGVEELDRIQRQSLADKQVARAVMYCTGRPQVGSQRVVAVQQSSGPNCWRQCGGYGHCATGCTDSGKLGHSCQFHVVVSATLSQVAAGKVTVKTCGAHVPPGGLAWDPVPLLGLTPSELVKSELVQNAMKFGQTATAVVNRSAGTYTQPKHSQSKHLSTTDLSKKLRKLKNTNRMVLPYRNHSS